MAAIEAPAATPQAGAPRACTNPQLAGLRTWPVAGFDVFRVYYPVRPELLIVVRILHGKQDTGGVLQRQAVDDPSKHWAT